MLRLPGISHLVEAMFGSRGGPATDGRPTDTAKRQKPVTSH
jgi:hypothetical protein